jgi:hypothetical protein
MTQHACPRCGLEFPCPHGSWADRHPAAAVCAGIFVGLPALYTVAGVILAYPWFFVPVLIVVCALLVARQQRRLKAVAARADWEHRTLMAGLSAGDMAPGPSGFRHNPFGTIVQHRLSTGQIASVPTTGYREVTGDRGR